MQVPHWLVTSTILLCFIHGCDFATPTNQKNALEAFYLATNGPSWLVGSGSLVGEPCVATPPWFGITCDPSDNIIGINLPDNELTGSLPDSLSDLPLQIL